MPSGCGLGTSAPLEGESTPPPSLALLSHRKIPNNSQGGTTMKNKTILGLLLGFSIWGATANAAQSAITCDRECLRGKVTQLLYAFVKHDVSKLPVSDTLRVTEDAVEKPLGKV